MTNGNGNRDDELEIIRQLLIATANRTEGNSESIDQLTDRMDHLTGRVDQLAIAQQNTQASLDQLAVLMVQFIENAQADRAIIREIQTEVREIQTEVREIQTEVRGLQTENRQILEYLFGQRPNGNGNES